MRVAEDVEDGEVLDRLSGAVREHLTGAHEAPEHLDDLYVEKLRGVEVVAVAKQPRFNVGAERRLQEQLRHGRRVDDDHADSRSRRMTSAAGTFSSTRERPWILASISSRVGKAAIRPISARR